MRGDLPWRLAGGALFGIACGVSWMTTSPDASRAVETGMSLLCFCLAIAGVMLLVSGRHWLDRAGGGGVTPIVRARMRRRTIR